MCQTPGTTFYTPTHLLTTSADLYTDLKLMETRRVKHATELMLESILPRSNVRRPPPEEQSADEASTTSSTKAGDYDALGAQLGAQDGDTVYTEDATIALPVYPNYHGSYLLLMLLWYSSNNYRQSRRRRRSRRRAAALHLARHVADGGYGECHNTATTGLRVRSGVFARVRTVALVVRDAHTSRR